ncbi:MAG: CoA transferase [Acidobacteria bacterium]|nr:CoA transferase [Acidobacteriota bacterium]
MHSSPGKNNGIYRSILEGIFVLDLADEKGSYCSRLLADLGAEVIKIEPPGGDPSRSLGPFYTDVPGGAPVSLSFFYNNLNKKSLVLDMTTDEGKHVFERLAERADVLVDTCSPDYWNALGFGSEKLRRANPRLVHLSITPFGQSGPKAAYHASAGIVSAFGGQTYVCSDGSGKPAKMFGMQPWYTASLFGAVSVLIRLRKRKRTGLGDFMDLSIQEAVASTLDHVLVDYFADGRVVHRQDSPTPDWNFSAVPCKDGSILLTILRNWDTLVEILASEKRSKDLLDQKWQEPDYREKHFDHILEVVKEWAGCHTKQELFELGQAMRFPWAPVATAREILESPQLQSRRFFIESNISGKKAFFPGMPYRFNSWTPTSPSPPPPPGGNTAKVIEYLDTHKILNNQILEHIIDKPSCINDNIFDDIRVLDLSRMLSGPYATRILADFGAEVIKVQTEKTARGAERNDTAYFSAWNRNKRSIRLDLDNAEARKHFLKLVAESDILVENYSPRVMKNWGLTYDRLNEVNPSLIMLSLSAMGQTGPWKDYVGFAPTFHALSGLMAASSVVPDSPAIIGHPYGDIIAGLYGAFSLVAALKFRDDTGKGMHIDLAGYEAMCTLLGPALMYRSLTQNADARSRWCEEYSQAVPDGCFPCRGNDRWCALTIKNDSEWKTFRRILGQTELESDKFSTTEGRKKNKQTIDTIIRRWTADRSAESIVQSLQEAGLAAGVVQNAEDISKDRQLAARKFFVSLKHPKFGDAIADRSCLWPRQSEPEGWKAAPLLGEADYEVFLKLLGMPEETFRDGIRRGIIG